MEPKIYDHLSDAVRDIGVSRQSYAQKHKKPFITRRIGAAKVFFIEWLELTSYLSQLDKYLLALTFQNATHSNLKGRPSELWSRKVSLQQNLCFGSERDWEMKFQLHHNFCSKMVGSQQVMMPNEAMTFSSAT